MTTVLGSSGITLSSGTQTTASPDLGSIISVTTYTSGTNTYTVPSGASKVYVQLIGGGGGSAGYCESGGAGGYAEGVYSISAGTNVTVTVGGGGGGVGYYAGAGSGGTSSFGSYCSATGGGGANTYITHGGGHGGVGSGGQVNLYGGSGTGHTNYGGHAQDGAGGAGYFGGGRSTLRSLGDAGFGAGSPGGGASGARCNDGNQGSTGNGGVVIVYALK
jgi:hypothetical protein